MAPGPDQGLLDDVLRALAVAVGQAQRVGQKCGGVRVVERAQALLAGARPGALDPAAAAVDAAGGRTRTSPDPPLGQTASATPAIGCTGP